MVTKDVPDYALVYGNATQVEEEKFEVSVKTESSTTTTPSDHQSQLFALQGEEKWQIRNQ